MRYKVTIKNKALKNLRKMPSGDQVRFAMLRAALEESGPMQRSWPNFSTLGKDAYHCHLSYHWIACWRHEAKTIEIEVYYVGSRENAPY